MRPELKIIELIEKYLRNELEEKDQIEFEKRIESNPEFRKEVELQRDLMNGIERLSLLKAIERAKIKYMRGKWLLKIGLGIIVISIIVVSTYLFVDQNSENSSGLYKLNEVGEPLWSDADRYLPKQEFKLNIESDTVIETEGGIVFAISKNAFVDENGNPVKGEVDLEVKEALDPASIITAGLSTESNGKPLETGGMFYFNARKDGKSLNINPQKEVLAEIPTKEIKSGMQLFDGKRKKDGGINWVNPKPLERYLIPVDIHTLNFYPQGYEDSLANWGYNVEDKAFKDSLFYSFFACEEEESTNLSKSYSMIWYGDRKIILKNYDPDGFLMSVDTTPYKETTWDSLWVRNCDVVEPSDIKAFWNDKFQNTNIATKEFEERLRFIHNKNILRLYIKNLHLPLYEIDSMVLQQFPWDEAGRFLLFHKRKDGRVKIKSDLAKNLSSYYSEKSKLYENSVRKVYRKFWNEERRKDMIAKQKQAQFSEDEVKRDYQNYLKELNLNLDEAYRQLGKPRPRQASLPNNRYRAALTSTGWKNVDRYVVASTQNRESLSFMDKEGNKATIKYQDVKVKVQDINSFDRVYSYVLSKGQYSFRRMKRNGDAFGFKMNEFLNYKLVIIAYQKGEMHFALQNISAREINIKLSPSNEIELKKVLTEYGTKQSRRDVWKDQQYESFKMADQARRAKNDQIKELRRRLYPVIFPSIGQAIPESIEE